MLHYSYVWAHFFRILEAGQSPNTTSTFLSDIDKHRAGVLLLQICFEILPKTILKSFNIWKTSIHILISCLNGASLFSYRERGITYSDKGRWIGRHCPMCAEYFSNMAASYSCFHCSAAFTQQGHDLPSSIESMESTYIHTKARFLPK